MFNRYIGNAPGGIWAATLTTIICREVTLR